MRKVIVFNRVSIDGFYAGPNGEIDWFVPDPLVDKAVHEKMLPDTLLLGRLTYQMFASYWPNVAADVNAAQGARVMANELDQMIKVVFSSTLTEVTWKNSRLVNADVTGEVGRMKAGEGADIAIFGSGSIVRQLSGQGLVDEYLILVTPVILGSGKLMFKDINTYKLDLLAATAFPSENVLLHYRVKSG
jgi:dihydrofolate reductase